MDSKASIFAFGIMAIKALSHLFKKTKSDSYTYRSSSSLVFSKS